MRVLRASVCAVAVSGASGTAALSLVGAPLWLAAVFGVGMAAAAAASWGLDSRLRSRAA